MDTTEVLKSTTDYYNYNLCSQCKGRCCTRMAGSYIPEDFKDPKNTITVEFILSLLKTGRFSIDWWEAATPIYYLRPRHINANVIDPSYGGTCVNWSIDKGCSLSESERPFGCRMLVPAKRGEVYSCKTKAEDKADKHGCASRWLEYQDILKEAINQFKS